MGFSSNLFVLPLAYDYSDSLGSFGESTATYLWRRGLRLRTPKGENVPAPWRDQGGHVVNSEVILDLATLLDRVIRDPDCPLPSWMPEPIHPAQAQWERDDLSKVMRRPLFGAELYFFTWSGITSTYPCDVEIDWDADQLHVLR